MKKYICLLIVFTISYQSFSQTSEFSEKDKTIIYTLSLNVLKNYQDIINRVGNEAVNNLEAAKSSSESFLELFVNRQVYIFNDLDPAHKLSKFYEAESYISNMVLWYPDGIKIVLDLANARVGNIMMHEESVYSLDILVTKKIEGNYLNQIQNKNTEELTFRVAFSYKNKSFENFRIVGVRNLQSGGLPDDSKNLEEVNSENLKEADILKVEEGLKTVLKDYTNFLALLGDAQEADADKVFYRTSFSALFPDENIKVFNDIAPKPESNLISIKQYLENYKTDYPSGIKNLSLNVDSAKFGKVIKMENGSLFTYVYASKFFSGFYKDKEVYREMFPLTFKISFNSSGKTFSDYKIQSIDLEVKNYFEQGQSNATSAMPETKIKVITRKGLGVTCYGPIGISSIQNQNFESLKQNTNNFTWDSKPSFGFSGGVGIYNFFSNNLAIKTSLELTQFQSNYSLDGSFQDSNLSLDVNSSSFYKRIVANYDSLVTINCLTVPILFNFTSGTQGKFGIYFEAGPEFSYVFSAKSTATGDFTYSGYYPYNPTVLQYLDLPELGFYSNTNINRKQDADISKLNVSVYGSAGVSIPLGYFTSLQIGPEFVLGISDILKNSSNYVDIFGNEFPHQPTRFKKYGMRIGLVYKL